MKNINSRNISLSCNKNGILTQPLFHDGYLKGVLLQNSNCTHVRLSTQDNEEYDLLLNDVKHLKLTNFREGNIILDIIIQNAKPVSVETLAHLLDLDSTHAEDKKYLIDMKHDIENGNLTMLTINPSYGGELLAICNSLEINRLS